ncbi:hypothetical protein KKE06_00970 [Candidatus Micrarchaeota archaeon]|nr:hypothetical protein [Candidatus Micrarchaeota archaeon]MBU1929876.1 hypothetical protein [Candidatus Micrarchaeota archaeon]
MKQKTRKISKTGASSLQFLEIVFTISKDAHPQIYDFFLEHLSDILNKMKQSKAKLTLVRLEPLNMMYAHLNVSNQIMHQIFLRYCKAHKLRAFSAFSPKQKFSCEGTVKNKQISGILEDYNLLFDLFFCDVRVQTTKLFIDCMDLFSNRLLVHGSPSTLKKFQKTVKRVLPKTKCRLV